MTLLAVACLSVFWVTMIQSECIQLSVERDGDVLDRSSVEFWASGERLESRQCSGGFSVSPEVLENGAEIVFVTPADRFEFGFVGAEDMRRYLQAERWRLEVDRPPFAPENWSLMTDVPRDVAEVLIIGFVPGSGFVTTRYDSARYSDQWAGSSWRDLLQRVDLLDATALVCVPAGKWTLTSRVKIVSAESSRAGESCGVERAIQGDVVRELTIEVLEDSPAADASNLFDAIVSPASGTVVPVHFT